MYGFILTLYIGFIFSYAARNAVGYKLPGGMLTTFIIGVIGAWSGYIKYFTFGPLYEKLYIIPSIIGSFLLVFLYASFGKVISNIKL